MKMMKSRMSYQLIVQIDGASGRQKDADVEHSHGHGWSRSHFPKAPLQNVKCGRKNDRRKGEQAKFRLIQVQPCFAPQRSSYAGESLSILSKLAIILRVGQKQGQQIQ